jgi:cytochrome c553
MKEAIISIVLVFGATAGFFAWMGTDSDRSLGFSNICPDGKTFCLSKPVEAKPVAAEVAVGAQHYNQCAACHGVAGEGGVGPTLAGQTSDMIVEKLTKYKNGETIGAQSAMMWGQASWMTDKDMKDIGDYVETL